MKKLSLSAKVLIGLVAGIFLGVLFGVHVAWMSIPGDVFIGLLQMTVLPYIMLSLIVNIGRLSMETGRKIVKYGLISLSMLLLIGLGGLLVLPLAFPEWGSGSFYSSDFTLPRVPFDFVKLYIPANPFESLSNNIVPAVVLFSIFVGLGVMKLPKKEALLQPLDILIDGLNQINKMIVRITPVGVFCIAAGVVSDLSWDDLSRLQGYLLIYLMAVLLLTFLVLPYIISIFTPFSPKLVFKMTRSTLITIFATGKIIVVFPQLIENIKEIIATNDELSEEGKAEVDIIMPLAYPFPNLGTLLIFIFVPFAAWYTGEVMEFSKYPEFLSSTLLSSFVAPITGLPFVLDQLKIPKETFQLFVVSTVLTDRMRVVLGAFHLITLTLLTICASAGIARLNKAQLIKGIIAIVISVTVGILGMNLLLKKSMQSIPTNEEIINRFTLISPLQPSEILNVSSRNPDKLRRSENILTRIKRRGKIRIGYYQKSMPFAFINKDSTLVGYGIDMAHQLAAGLKVSIEFVPVDHGMLVDHINNDYYDIVMSDIFTSSDYAEEIEMSNTYLDVSLALLVAKDNNDFNDYKAASLLDTFTIAFAERPEIANEFLTYFPNAQSCQITDLKDFMNQDTAKSDDSIEITHLDAFLTSAERGSAMTVFYPGFKVVNPLPYHMSNGLVFPLANDEVWRRYVNKWIEFRTKDGSFQHFYDQWILGHEFKKEQEIWSIYDNVIRPAWLSYQEEKSSQSE